jgi:hypothetical protein
MTREYNCNIGQYLSTQGRFETIFNVDLAEIRRVIHTPQVTYAHNSDTLLPSGLE